MLGFSQKRPTSNTVPNGSSVKDAPGSIQPYATSGLLGLIPNRLCLNRTQPPRRPNRHEQQVPRHLQNNDPKERTQRRRLGPIHGAGKGYTVLRELCPCCRAGRAMNGRECHSAGQSRNARAFWLQPTTSAEAVPSVRPGIASGPEVFLRP